MTNKKSYPLLTEQEQSDLNDALHYMKVAELRNESQALGLPEKGTKPQLIKRILTFIQTGRILQPPSIPSISRAKNHPPQPLEPTSLMLYGAYKNDLKTRIFFKQLIDPHFHFTAFGIDWLNERWLEGNPPTYEAFAQYWAQETERRKQQKVQPKQEWALIRFMQHMSKTKPEATKTELIQAWKTLQASKAQFAHHMLILIAKKLREA